MPPSSARPSRSLRSRTASRWRSEISRSRPTRSTTPIPPSLWWPTDGEATLCYTADTAPGERALAAARGCDLLLAEATLPQEYAGAAPHLTASEAAKLAHDAGAKCLVLTHVWPTNDRDTMVRLASEVFAGEIHIAEEFSAYDVP